MPTPRYEREIRSILDKMPTFPGDTQGGESRRRSQPPAPRASLRLEAWWSRDAYLMAALLIALARFGGPALGGVGTHLLAWIAAALVLFAIVVSVVRAFAEPRAPKMWRGRAVYPSRTGGPDVLAAWWRRVTGRWNARH